MTTDISTTVTDADLDDAPRYAPYCIMDADAAAAAGRSLPVLLFRRQCYMCQQGYEESQAVALDSQDLMLQIAAHCAIQQDFLLPDTPLKEAIFRALLENSNEPMSAEDISATLTEKWAMTPFPRDTSPEVIQRLLDNISYYCVARV